MILTVVASVAVLASWAPPPAARTPGSSELTLSRDERPLDTAELPPAIGRALPSQRSLTQRRDHKPQGLAPHATATRQTVSIRTNAGGPPRRCGRASTPRSPRAPPLPA
jgi:hypothetical protein